MKKHFSDLDSMNYELQFKVNEERVAARLVGEIEYSFSNKSLFTKMNIINRLKTGKSTVVNIDHRSTDSCLIYDQNYILTANYRDNSLTLYDKNLRLFQKIDDFSGFTINPFSITTNNLDRIYVSDRDNHRIFMFDYKFKMHGVVGTRGSTNYQFEYPRGITYAANSLYICDWINKRVQKYSAGLLFKASYRLDYNPIQIKAAGNTVCVRSEKTSLYFYDLDRFQLKHKYDHNGSIYSIDSNFYEYFHDTNKFYCYDDNGEMIEELPGPDVDFTVNDWANMIAFNDSFILLPESCTKIIVF